MRMNKMEKWKEKCFDLLLNSLNIFFKKIYGVQSGEFLGGYRSLKI